MAKVKITELVAPLYEATRLLTKLKPQPTSSIRFTTFCNQPSHIGESKQADVGYWVDNVDSEDIYIRCKCCGDLSMEQILNPATVENTPVNDNATQVEINPPVSDSLPIDLITVDLRLQARMEKELDLLVVSEYAELMATGVIFPPVVVFFDGQTRWLAEGFHRIAAAKQAGFTSISVTVIEGDFRAATLHSLGSNADHGKRRTNADKRHVVEMMLKDEKWSAWSDRAIADQCRVTHTFVAGIRKSLLPVYLETLPDSEVTKPPETVRKAIRNGKQYAVNTANIGRKQEPVKPTVPVKQEPVEQENTCANFTSDSAEPESVKPNYDDPVYIKKAQDDASLDSFYKFSETAAAFCNEKNAEFLKNLLIDNSDYYRDRWKRKVQDSIGKVMIFLDNKDVYMKAFDDVLFAVVPHHVKSDSNTELNKLNCELAYLKSKIRDVYFDKASIQLDANDEITFITHSESN